MKEIVEKLKKAFDDSGMASADAFVDKLEELKKMVKEGPGDIMDKVTGAMKDFKESIQKAIDDPSSLAPAGGMAACAAWYGNAVAAKLKDLADIASKLFESIKELAGQIKKPLEDLSKTMEGAMAGIAGAVKGLAKMPNEVQDLAKVDLAKADKEVDDIKKCLDVKQMEQPLKDLGGLKEVFGPLITKVKDGFQLLMDFISDAPDKVKNAFSVPPPLCFLQSVLMSQAPPIMKTMLDKLDMLSGLDTKPLMDMLGNANDSIGSMDVKKVQDPVSAFVKEATEQVGKIDNLVKGAKLAANPAGAVPGMGGGMLGK